VIPFLSLLRSRFAGYVIGGILASALIGWHAIKVSRLESRVADCRAEMSALMSGYDKAARLQQGHALRLVQAARDEERAAWQARYQREQEAAQGLSEAAREAQAREADWRRRYRDALKEPGCAEWSAQPVVCPVR
jgi:biopolymer transport protein ExbB/TolQ